MKLSIEKLERLKWKNYKDNITKCTVSYLEHFSGDFNFYNNCIVIITEVKKGKTIHNISISCGEWGETGFQKEYSIPKKLVKQEIKRIVKDSINRGDEYYY